MELPALDENKLGKIIAYKQAASGPRPDEPIIAHGNAYVNGAATFISAEGETVARQMRQIQKRLNPEEGKQIILAYQNGKSTNELAREHGRNRKTICEYLKKNGVDVSCGKIKTEGVSREIIALYEQNNTIEEIAKRFGFSTAVIQRHLHEKGVRVRSRWDYR